MDYPKWKYHAEHGARLVQNATEEAALGQGWWDSPADVNKAPPVSNPPSTPTELPPQQAAFDAQPPPPDTQAAGVATSELEPAKPEAPLEEAPKPDEFAAVEEQEAPKPAPAPETKKKHKNRK